MIIYNKTGNVIEEIINGTAVRIPAHGEADTTPRKAEIILARHPQALSRVAGTAYTAEQEQIVKTWPAAKVLDLALRLMKGEMPAVVADAPAQAKDEPKKDNEWTRKGSK